MHGKGPPEKGTGTLAFIFDADVRLITIYQTEKAHDPVNEGFSYNAPYFGQIQGWQLPGSPLLKAQN
jgi:hypothetical protein